MYATKEQFAAAKVKAVIMVQGNPGQGFTVVGSAHRLWGSEPKRIEVFELPQDNDPPPVKVKRFAGTKQEYEEDAPDPDRIGLRSLREMKQPGSRLSIWGDGESVGAATAASLATVAAEAGRLGEENATLKGEISRLEEELEAARAEIDELKTAAARGATQAGGPPAKTDAPAPAKGAETPAADDKGNGKGKDTKAK